VSGKRCVQNRIHIQCSVAFLRKSCRLWDNVEECIRSRQATDGGTIHALCMLDI